MDDERFMTRHGGTTSIRTLRRVLRGLGVFFGIGGLVAAVSGGENRVAVTLLGLGTMAACWLLAAFPGALRRRTPDGVRLNLRGNRP